ncbi:cyclophilin-like fold protein [Hylemonella sp. W303a]|uniref:cyclophilin-like fold protein n=1 Tax=Hylemonella sp. W303a TaxID=3389873 RepID=UPI00396B033B
MFNPIQDAGAAQPCERLGIAGSRVFSRRSLHWRGWTLLIALLSGGFGAQAAGPADPVIAQQPVQAYTEEKRMWITVGDHHRYSITLADTDAARAFAARLPLTLDMEELNGNEKKKELAAPLPTDASKPGTIRNGDLMLWGSRTVVLFYLTFDSPYAYTRIGRIDNPANLPQTLGRGDVRVKFSRN